MADTTPINERSVPVSGLLCWVKAGARCGFNVEPIFQAHGIELSLAHLEDGRIAIGRLDAVLDECVARARGEHFPLAVGDAYAFDFLPEIETFVTTSSSLRDAARALDWVPMLLNPLLAPRLEESGDLAHLIADPPPGTPRPGKAYHLEIFLASLYRVVRMLLGEDAAPRALRLTQPPRDYADRLRRFFRAPVEFEAPRDEILFARELLDRPLEGDFPGLHEQAAELVAQRVARLHRADNWRDQVANALASDPSLLQVGVPALAQRLGLGSRSLERRLAAEGTTPAALLDDARRRRAEQLLRRGHADLETIAGNLGFSDRRSFTRAFKRWHGVTPSAYRRDA